MRLALASIALLIMFAPAADAQSEPEEDAVRGIQIALTRSISAPHQGWGWGEAARTVGVRVGVPFARRALVWAGADRAELNGYACPDVTPGCVGAGTPYLLQAGIGFRGGPDAPGRVVPFIGAGAGVEHWTGGQKRWSPHVHGGLDWMMVRPVAFRIEAQSDWQYPARIGTGVVLNIR